jgi:long-chain acyl-CoA synthetase
MFGAMTSTGHHHLGVLAQDAYERRADYPALLFEGRWYGSGELFDRSRRIAAGLTALGVGAGERVVVTMANCPDVSVAYQAIWRAGAVVTPATFLLPAADLAHVIADAGARAVLTTPDQLDKVRAATADLDCVGHVICTEDAGDRALPLAALEQSDPAPIVARADEDLAALLYTGGTTGRAKGVMLSHAALDFTGRRGQEASYLPGATRGLMTLPLSHSYGLLVTLVGLHHPEPPVTVLLRWFDPAAFLALIAEHRLQTTAVVPTMLQILLGHPLEDHDLSSLRSVTSGGAPLAPEVEAEFRRRVPSASIRQGYGLTETAALICTNPAGRERPGTVGLPVPGTELRILDGDDHPVAAGQPGEICVRSPGVMQGYWGAPEATAEALRDGWLRTGDIGYQDQDGYVSIVDRKKDLIIRGGFNVYPRDVEDALLAHPAIEMAAVVGRPDPVSGEEVVAFVALRDGAALTERELVEWGRRQIGGYRYPREVHLVDAVPLTAVGKLDRKALRARARDDAEGEPARRARSDG